MMPSEERRTCGSCGTWFTGSRNVCPQCGTLVPRSTVPVNAESDFQVPIGFDLAHEEWLAIGGKQFQEECWSVGCFAVYRTRYWALVRQAIFARDSATCFRCQASAGHVHHLTYDFIGIDHLHPETLVSVCAPCHQLVEYGKRVPRHR